jgi:hypothetical protein
LASRSPFWSTCRRVVWLMISHHHGVSLGVFRVLSQSFSGEPEENMEESEASQWAPKVINWIDLAQGSVEYGALLTIWLTFLYFWNIGVFLDLPNKWRWAVTRLVEALQDGEVPGATRARRWGSGATPARRWGFGCDSRKTVKFRVRFLQDGEVPGTTPARRWGSGCDSFKTVRFRVRLVQGGEVPGATPARRWGSGCDSWWGPWMFFKLSSLVTGSTEISTNGFPWGKVRPARGADSSGVLVVPIVKVRMEVQRSIPLPIGVTC